MVLRKIILILLLTGLFFVGWWLGRRSVDVRIIEHTRIDTAYFERPQPHKILSSAISVEVPKWLFAPADTTFTTVTINPNRDSVPVQLPFERREYRDMNEDLKHKAINLLKELGYTAYRISQDTGLSQSIIGQWLSGKVEPSEANAKYILLYYSNREPSISSMEDQKFISFFEKRDRQYEIILTQNSEIIRQNGEILQRVLKYIDDNNSK